MQGTGPRISAFLLGLILGLSTETGCSSPSSAPFAGQVHQPPAGSSSDQFAEKREQMVRAQLQGRGVRDEQVLQAMRKVPRHLFVPPALRKRAYADSPLPIGYGQTISQPFMVAYMTQALGLKGRERVLEIGTGSGYQAAVLAEIAGEVYTIEIVEPLARRAEKLLRELDYQNLFLKVGDGFWGWAEKAPFDAIIVTAAAAKAPPWPLVQQLRPGGRLLIPLGKESQALYRITKRGKGLHQEKLMPVHFVPLMEGTEARAPYSTNRIRSSATITSPEKLCLHCPAMSYPSHRG